MRAAASLVLLVVLAGCADTPAPPPPAAPLLLEASSVEGTLPFAVTFSVHGLQVYSLDFGDFTEAQVALVAAPEGPTFVEHTYVTSGRHLVRLYDDELRRVAELEVRALPSDATQSFAGEIIASGGPTECGHVVGGQHEATEPYTYPPELEGITYLHAAVDPTTWGAPYLAHIYNDAGSALAQYIEFRGPDVREPGHDWVVHYSFGRVVEHVPFGATDVYAALCGLGASVAIDYEATYRGA